MSMAVCRHGNGVYQWIQGDKYEGMWWMGLMHGYVLLIRLDVNALSHTIAGWVLQNTRVELHIVVNGIWENEWGMVCISMLLAPMNLIKNMLANGQTTCFTGSGSASPKMVCTNGQLECQLLPLSLGFT
jgi:hypothetical protein